MKTPSSKTRGHVVAMFFTLATLLGASSAFADEKFMDPGTHTEMTERRERFESNPDRVMGVLESLKDAGYARTAYRSAKLYRDSGVADFRLRNFINSQDYSKLTDK